MRISRIAVEDLDGSEKMSGEEGGSSYSSGEDGDDDDDNSEGQDMNGDDNRLDPAHHPLLRPGALPRMSKASIEMAVGFVEDAFGGGSNGERRGEEGEDELDKEE